MTPGLSKCGSCRVRPRISEGSKLKLPNGAWHSLKSPMNCDTSCVLYLLTCECGAYYVGKTKRALRKRILDHVYDINVGRLNRPISRHVGLHHKYDPNVLSCWALEHVPESSWGGEWDSTILQREAHWIFNLGATTPPGLNDGISYKSFL